MLVTALRLASSSLPLVRSRSSPSISLLLVLPVCAIPTIISYIRSCDLARIPARWGGYVLGILNIDSRTDSKSLSVARLALGVEGIPHEVIVAVDDRLATQGDPF